MIRPLALLAPLAALALASCGGGGGATGDTPVAETAAAVAPPASQQWTDAVARSPEGGYVMGNPNAPVKLVEFGSLTCHVCADFAANGVEPLKTYVKSGTVSYEFRNFIRNGVDLTAAQLAQCVPDAAFFPVTEALYADQETWFGSKVDALNAQLTGLQNAPPAQTYQAITRATGLDSWFAGRGLSTPAQAKCLSDTAAAEKLEAARDSATSEFDITGTPTFVLNGQTFQIEVDPTKGSMWEQVERAITRAGGRKA